MEKKGIFRNKKKFFELYNDKLIYYRVNIFFNIFFKGCKL